MIRKIIPLCLLVLVINISCSNDEEKVDDASVDLPTAANLVFPNNDTKCNEGMVISDTETDVLFQWEKATNASSYILKTTNLNDGTSRENKTISNEFLIRLLRGTKYSWVVKSKVNNSNETAESETWNFYNTGLPEESHPPFPADAVSPQIGSSIDAGEITLQWEATDVDNDISSYTILLDIANPPLKELGIPRSNTINVTVSAGQVYYWKVITTDEGGNASNSQVFQFNVN